MTSSFSASRFLLDPFQRFFERESSGGIVLFIAAVMALFMANSPWQDVYSGLLQAQYTVGVEAFSSTLSLHAWINDGLMAIFFFLVGLEIKRQFLVGELSEPRKALLPIVAAIGGMLMPAAIFIALNPPGTPYNAGWAIPSVTDIAFSLGVLALLGKRVPLYLKIFLTALAIVDDLGAIVIIALFYTHQLNWGYLGLAGLNVGLLLLFNAWGIRKHWVYILTGILLWAVMLQSGVHTTIAGVLLAMTIPATSKIRPDDFHRASREVLATMPEIHDPTQHTILTEDDYQTGVQNLESLCEEAQAPLQRLEHALHPWVTYGIMPLFAFANAGVPIQSQLVQSAVFHPMTLGVVLGLVLGKCLGIFGFSWLCIKLKWAALPDDVGYWPLLGIACLGGIGFTMSLFIADLAFSDTLLDMAKIGVFIASLLSGLLGYLLLATFLKRSAKNKEA